MPIPMQDFHGRDSNVFWDVWGANAEKVRTYFETNKDAPTDLEAKRQSNHRNLDFAAYNGVTVDMHNASDGAEIAAKLLELENKRQALGDIAKILLEKGSDPLHKDTMDRYALTLAFNSANIWVINALMAPGVKRPSVLSLDKWGRNFWHAFCCSAQDEASKVRGLDEWQLVFGQLEKLYADELGTTNLTEACNQPDNDGFTPLEFAKHYGFTEIFKILYGDNAEEEMAKVKAIEPKQDYFGRDSDGFLAACFVNGYDTVDAALQAGADPLQTNFQAGARDAAALASTGLSDAKLLGRLIEAIKKQDPKASALVTADVWGGLKLHWATYSGRADTTEKLLEEDVVCAHINDQDADGNTVGHSFSMARKISRPAERVAVMKMLLAKGLDPTITNKQGLTMLEFAEFRGNDVVAKIIRDALTLDTAQTNMPLLTAFKSSLKVGPKLPTILLVFNGEYADQAENILASIKKNAPELVPAITICVSDERSKAFALAHKLRSFELGNITATGNYGSKPFNIMMTRKIEGILHLLRLGEDVLYTDTDVVFLANPLKEFDLNCDINIQNDAVSAPYSHANLCAGFMYLKSKDHVIEFLENVIDLIVQHNYAFDDQRAMNNLLQQGHPISINVLNESKFANGCRYFDNSDPSCKKEDALIVHNNWITGMESKRKRFEKFGLIFEPARISENKLKTLG